VTASPPTTENILSLFRTAFQAPELGETQPWFSVRPDPVAALAASLALEDTCEQCLPPALLLTHPDAVSVAGFLHHPAPCFHEYKNLTLGNGDKRIIFIHGDPNMGGLYLPALANALPGFQLEVVIEPDILVRENPYSHSARLNGLIRQPPFQTKTPPAALGGYCNGGLAALQLAGRADLPPYPASTPVFWIHPHHEALPLHFLDRGLQLAEFLGICPPDFALKCMGRFSDAYFRKKFPGVNNAFYNDLLLQRPIAHRHRALTRRMDLIRKRDQILNRLVRRCRTPVPAPTTVIFHPEGEPLALSMDPQRNPGVHIHSLAGTHNQWKVEEVARVLLPLMDSCQRLIPLE